MPSFDKTSNQVNHMRAEPSLYSSGKGYTSMSVWFMIVLGCILVYIPGIVYAVEVYLRTIDDDGNPDEAMLGEPIHVIAIRYGVGLTSKTYDYITLAGRILSILGACILSLSFYYSRRLLIQMFMLVFGFGCVASVKPLLYSFRDSTEDRMLVPFRVITAFGYIGFVLVAVSIYWVDVFQRLSRSFWLKFTLNSLVIIGALLWTSSVLIGAFSCSRGGTFMPEVVVFSVSFWIAFAPLVYLGWRTGLHALGPGEDIPFYTPESTPMLPDRNYENDKLIIA